MNKIILLACLVFAIHSANADKSSDAIAKAADAAYVQTGVKANVDQLANHLEKQYVPKELEKYGGTLAAILKSIMDRALTLKWTF